MIFDGLLEFKEFKYYTLNGIKIPGLTISEIRNYFFYILSNRFSQPLQIITLNLDFLRIASKNVEFNNICKKAGLVLPDGNGITSLVRLKYGLKLQRITGNDIFRILLQLSEELPIKIALIGSTEEVLSSVCDKIKHDFPKTSSILTISPPWQFEVSSVENRKIINNLKEFSPDIIFLALGCPRQEFWLDKNKDEINAKINVGVGAVFDFYSGKTRRSPILFQNLGLEWVWRLLLEPERLYRRYLFQDLPFYFFSVLRLIREFFVRKLET